jgi:hypothetical protein
MNSVKGNRSTKAQRCELMAIDTTNDDKIGLKLYEGEFLKTKNHWIKTNLTEI